MNKHTTEIVNKVINAYGGISKVQNRFNYGEPMGVYNWRSRGIPKALLAEIHIDTGINIETLLSATRNKIAA